MLFKTIKLLVKRRKYKEVNLYYQDESRFGLKTHVGRCLTAFGIKPIVKVEHQFQNTYLYQIYLRYRMILTMSLLEIFKRINFIVNIYLLINNF